MSLILFNFVLSVSSLYIDNPKFYFVFVVQIYIFLLPSFFSSLSMFYSLFSVCINFFPSHRAWTMFRTVLFSSDILYRIISFLIVFFSVFVISFAILLFPCYYFFLSLLGCCSLPAYSLTIISCTLVMFLFVTYRYSLPICWTLFHLAHSPCTMFFFFLRNWYQMFHLRSSYHVNQYRSELLGNKCDML